MIANLRFRHIFGDPIREKYDGTEYSTTSSESCLLKGNKTFIAWPWRSTGGGTVAVLRNNNPHRLAVQIPLIRGHSGPILDLDFNPFNDYVLATGSEDTSIKIWNIPEEITQDMHEPAITLSGHQKKIGLIQFHPAAENVLASTAYDSTVRIWDIVKEEQKTCINIKETPYGLDWSLDGKLLATASKDKLCKIIDPRADKVVHEIQAHEGPKSQKFVFLGTTGYGLSCGFSKTFERELKVWDLNNLAAPVSVTSVDSAAGALLPFFDEDTGCLHLTSKGEGLIRFYELTEDKKFHLNTDYRSNVPGRAYGFLPKTALDVSRHEIGRFLKLTDNYIESIRIICPRKSEEFQEDLFPEARSEEPALSSEEWFGGKDELPKRRSLRPGAHTAGAQVRTIRASNVSEELRERVEKLTALVADLETEVNSLRGQVTERDTTIQQLNQTIEELRAENEKLKAQ